MRYLFLTYYTKPNGQIDEALTIANKIKLRDHQTVNVILDFKELKVIKSIMNDTTVPKDWDRIVSYYYPFYTRVMERLFHENGHEINLKKNDE
jgi:hypothetical protein